MDVFFLAALTGGRHGPVRGTSGALARRAAARADSDSEFDDACRRLVGINIHVTYAVLGRSCARVIRCAEVFAARTSRVSPKPDIHDASPFYPQTVRYIH